MAPWARSVVGWLVDPAPGGGQRLGAGPADRRAGGGAVQQRPAVGRLGHRRTNPAATSA